MKVKTDYVTNSSSASFILYITSSIMDLKEFKAFIENYINRESNEYGAGTESRSPSISEISNGVFKVEEFTGVYNGFEDVPSWMIDMMVKKSFIDNGYEDGLPKEILGFIFSIGNN